MKTFVVKKKLLYSDDSFSRPMPYLGLIYNVAI